MDLWVILYNPPKKPWMLGLCHQCPHPSHRPRFCQGHVFCNCSVHSLPLDKQDCQWWSVDQEIQDSPHSTCVFCSPWSWPALFYAGEHDSQIFESATSGLRSVLDKVVKECHFFSVTPPCSCFLDMGSCDCDTMCWMIQFMYCMTVEKAVRVRSWPWVLLSIGTWEPQGWCKENFELHHRHSGSLLPKGDFQTPHLIWDGYCFWSHIALF